MTQSSLVISEATRTRLELELANFNSENSAARKRFDAEMKKWDERLKPMEIAILESEQLTEADFGIRFRSEI